MIRTAYFAAGALALLLGAIGLFLPLLPTIPFVILAAFCFARSSPRLEARLLAHPTLGPHIIAWRSRGAISRKGKSAALLAFAASALIGLLALRFPWSFAPLAASLIGGAWIATRPEA
jgi:uncharacterized membrane protein YbaN (DUF454 family)